MTAIAATPVYRFEAHAMASPLRLTVAGGDEGHATRAWGAVRDEFEACEEAMSRFRETSEITALNRASVAGRALRVSDRLRRALVATDRARRLTGGRFDPRVLRDLDRLGYRGASVEAPSPTVVGEAGRPGGAGDAVGRAARRVLDLDEVGAVRLREPVDLGGIGKGLALRWAATRARRLLGPVPGLLLEAGGDLVASGPAPGDGPWLVGVEDPGGGSEPLAVIAVGQGAVATSSLLVNRWRGPSGVAVHHLIDPTSGDPGDDGLASVTVLAPDPAWAEVRTKELFLAGERAIGPLARSIGLAAWWVTAAGRLEMTPAGRMTTAWLGPAAPG